MPVRKNFDVHALTDADIIRLAKVLRKANECAFCTDGSHAQHEIVEAFVNQADALIAANAAAKASAQ